MDGQLPEPEPIEVDDQAYPICPYCGHTFSDPCDLRLDRGEIECYKCENTYRYDRTVTVTYSTTKKELEKT